MGGEMSECKVLDALVSNCQECVKDCEDAKYEVLKLLAEAKEVKDFDIYGPPNPGLMSNAPSWLYRERHLLDWRKVTFWARR